jgi:hypothetical protein
MDSEMPKKPSLTDPRRTSSKSPPRAQAVRLPPGSVFRIFVLATLAVVATVWAIWRHYTVPPAKMLVPKPAPSEIEVEPAP